MTALKYSSDARLTSTDAPASARAALRASLMRSSQKAYRSSPAGFDGVPISEPIGLDQVERTKNAVEPESVRTCCCANCRSATDSVSASKPTVNITVEGPDCLPGVVRRERLRPLCVTVCIQGRELVTDLHQTGDRRR